MEERCKPGRDVVSKDTRKSSWALTFNSRLAYLLGPSTGSCPAPGYRLGTGFSNGGYHVFLLRAGSPEQHERKKQRLSRTASTNEPVNSKGQYEREKKFERRKKSPAGTSSTARSRDGVGLVLMAVGVNTVATTSKQHGRVALPRGKVPDAIDPFAFN